MKDTRTADKSNELPVKMLSFDISTDSMKFVDVDGGILVKDVLLLDEGEWTDSSVGSKLFYPAKTLEKDAQNWVDNIIWSRHSGGGPRDATDVVGRVKNINFQNTGIHGDLFFHCRTEKSRDVATLVKAGEINAVSVEHFWTEKYSPENKRWEADSLKFRGIVPVDKGACKTCLIKRNHASETVDDDVVIDEVNSMNDEDIKKILDGFKADMDARFKGITDSFEEKFKAMPAPTDAKMVGELSAKIDGLVKEMGAKDERIKALEQKPAQKGVAYVTKEPAKDGSIAGGYKIDKSSGTISKI